MSKEDDAMREGMIRGEDGRWRAPGYEDATKLGEFSVPAQNLVHTPTADEAQMALAAHTCGQCRYFELDHGQAQMRVQRFAERLVREQQWQLKYLASPLNEIGICGAHDSGAGGDQMATGKMTAACDQFREARGIFSLRRKNR